MIPYELTFSVADEAPFTRRIPLPTDDSAITFARQALESQIAVRRPDASQAVVAVARVGCEGRLGAWAWTPHGPVWTAGPEPQQRAAPL